MFSLNLCNYFDVDWISCHDFDHLRSFVVMLLLEDTCVNLNRPTSLLCDNKRDIQIFIISIISLENQTYWDWLSFHTPSSSTQHHLLVGFTWEKLSLHLALILWVWGIYRPFSLYFYAHSLQQITFSATKIFDL